MKDYESTYKLYIKKYDDSTVMFPKEADIFSLIGACLQQYKILRYTRTTAWLLGGNSV
jgi:hypothetical protein